MEIRGRGTEGLDETLAVTRERVRERERETERQREEEDISKKREQ